MKRDHESKCYLCKFCKQSFSNGKKLGGHMRCHLALISAARKQSTQEINQESINGVGGFNLRKERIQENDQEFIYGEQSIDSDEDDEIVKKSQRIVKDFDVNCRKQGIQESDGKSINFEDDNVYVLRENPKRSWRVSNSSNDLGNFCVQCGKGFQSSKALASHKRCHSRTVSIKNNVCEKCGKGFDSVKALYGHMRCHSIKRSRSFDESSATFSSSNEHDGVANPVRKKRSCTRYKSPSSCDNDDGEVEQGAICLMMLSRGLRDMDGVKLVISNQPEFSFSRSGYPRSIEKNVEFEVSVDDGSMKFCEFKNKNDLGLKRDLVFGSGSGSVNPGQARSTKTPMSCDQDLSHKDVTNAKISAELKRRSKDYKCLICFKEFASGQALGSHKRIHNKHDSKAIVSDDIPDMRRLVDLNLEGGLDDVEFKLTWVHCDIEWDPLTMVIRCLIKNEEKCV